ncbi:MAG: hypothetical protein J3K34DRAFT_107117 [Monoraphidium minutum]|nr:MAG: hypothetical protein J3K34DRAFT_107117 [Monoraphidium minutum]
MVCMSHVVWCVASAGHPALGGRRPRARLGRRLGPAPAARGARRRRPAFPPPVRLGAGLRRGPRGIRRGRRVASTSAAAARAAQRRTAAAAHPCALAVVSPSTFPLSLPLRIGRLLGASGMAPRTPGRWPSHESGCSDPAVARSPAVSPSPVLWLASAWATSDVVLGRLAPLAPRLGVERWPFVPFHPRPRNPPFALLWCRVGASHCLGPAMPAYGGA